MTPDQNLKQYATDRQWELYLAICEHGSNKKAAKDAYAHWGGYRAQRDMKAIVHHRELGEVSRIHVRPEMLKGAA